MADKATLLAAIEAGGTIYYGNLEALLSALVSSTATTPKEYGAVGDGFTDDTAAVQAAIAAAVANRRLSSDGPSSELQHGYPVVLLDGWYQVDEALAFAGNLGVTFVGVGPLASGLIFTGTSGTLFDLTGWGHFEFRDLGLVAGSVTEGADGKPDIAFETAGSRTNTCFDLDGTGGGTQLVRRNCLMAGWAVVDKSTGTVNNDDVRAYDCRIAHNDLVVNNTNPQAVMWRYENCKLHHNENTFKNLGAFARIVGCDVIDKGKFLDFTGLASIGTGWVVEGCKFEDYQNFDATTNPQWLAASGGASVSGTFRGCSSVVGTAYAKTSVSLTGGITRVRFEDCELTGDLEITAGTSDDGILPVLIFENSVVPTINQTLVSGQANTPINLIVRDSTLSGTDDHQVINRQFWGSLASASDEISVAPMRVAAAHSATVNATSSGKAVPVWCPAPYKLAVMGARIVAEHNTTNAFTITLWQDSTKTTKVLEVTGVGTGTSGVPFFEEVRQSGLTTETVLDSASDPLFLEITAAGNAGLVAVRVEIDLMQATL